MNLAHRIKALDEWLESMKQQNGYGGPVSHWWQSCYQFVGPGLDWRYEGLLTGYARLWEKTGDPRWSSRLEVAAGHLVRGQLATGSYVNSRFEANPGTLGTPHEAAASLGLLRASQALQRPDLVEVAAKNLDHLIEKLWDEARSGFNDCPGVYGRVPNKLATLAEALLLGATVTGRAQWLDLADMALADVVRLQVQKGPLAGAVHQWAQGRLRGDGRFFPYYNARCIPALVEGARLLANPQYRQAAEAIGDFLEKVRNSDGSWPQLLYENGRRIEYPHWMSPLADILYAYLVLERPLPPGGLDVLLAGQLPTGGFITAEGFRRRYRPSARLDHPDYLDVTPVVGWNDKAFRLLAELAPQDISISHAALTSECTLPITIGGRPGWYHESQSDMSITTHDGESVFVWTKPSDWSKAVDEVMVR